MSIAKQLSEDFSIYIPDQRNHGLSFHSTEWNYDVMVEDLDRFIEYHNLSDPIIMGHSMGGKVAMNYATSHPMVVSKLIVVDMAPRYYPVRHGRILEGLNSIPVEILSSRTDADKMLQRYIPEMGVRQFLLKNLTRNDTGNFEWKINLPVIAANIERVGSEVPHGQFIGPSLFIEGGNSDYIPRADEEHIMQLFPNAVIAAIPDAGHSVQAPNPGQYLDIESEMLTL